MRFLPIILVSLEMSENDRRLLMVLLVVFVVLLFLAGFIGMLIRYISNKMGDRIVSEIAEPIKYHIIPNEKAALKYAKIKNARLFTKQATPGILTLLGVLVFWVVFSLFTLKGAGFTANHFKIASELMFHFDLVWEKNAIGIYDLMAITLSSTPAFEITHIASYIISIAIILAGTYLLVVAQAYLARGQELRRSIRVAYKRTLDGFNFYDDAAEAAKAEAKDKEQQQ